MMLIEILIQFAEVPEWPSTVCGECLATVNNFSDFRDNVRDNQTIIAQKYGSSVTDLEIESVDNASPELDSMGVVETPSNRRVTRNSSEPSKAPTKAPREDINGSDFTVTVRTKRKADESEDRQPRRPLKRRKETQLSDKLVDQERNASKAVWLENRTKVVEERNRLDVHMIAMDLFTCDLCDASRSASYMDHLDHYRKVHKMRGYILCCMKKHLTSKAAYDHIKLHLDKDAFRCDECGKCFVSSKLLSAHKKVHMPDELCPYKCTECGKTFAILTTYKTHILAHAGDEARIHKCAQCPKSFKTVRNLIEHVQRLHEKVKQYVCSQCGISVKDKHNLAQHYRAKHDPTRTKEPCNICGLLVLEVDKHKRRKHMLQPVDQVFGCDQCDKKFKFQKNVQEHKRRCHSDNGEETPCPICGKLLKRKVYLDRHILSHSGVKPYVCYFCSYAATTTGNRVKHMKCRHPHKYDAYKASKYQPIIIKEVV